MEVYAEYIAKGNQCYRYKTLLCFGNSSKLIGSAVLMNPGSAQPQKSIQDEPHSCSFIKQFYKENHGIAITNLELWHKFSVDSTMQQLEKIFNGYYIDKQIELSGVIQLFNCFYYKDPKPQNTIDFLNTNEITENNFFSEHKLISNRPTYFGWGNEGKYGSLNRIAQEIFSTYMDNRNMTIYSKNFEENNFYHPRYLNCSYRTEKNQQLLKNFYNCLYE